MICTRCTRDLPEDHFALDLRRRSRRKSWCRRCEREDWDMRGRGIRPIGARNEDDPAEMIFVCQCQPAVLADPGIGACQCGLPIIARMNPRAQAVMDEKWPGWRAQVVMERVPA